MIMGGGVVCGIITFRIALAYLHTPHILSWLFKICVSIKKQSCFVLVRLTLIILQVLIWKHVAGKV
jgi:hypothetical protein